MLPHSDEIIDAGVRQSIQEIPNLLEDILEPATFQEVTIIIIILKKNKKAPGPGLIKSLNLKIMSSSKR